MEQRLSLVSLGVRDLAAARAFYEKLGWQASPKNSNDNIVFFQLGGIVLGLYSRAALAEEARLIDQGGFGGITLAHNGRSKQEVDQILAKEGVERGKEREWQGVKLSQASPEELEGVLGDTILKEFKLRLERIGLEYQTPIQP